MAKRRVTWLGNSNKKEFHRIVFGEQQPAGCRLVKMDSKHGVPSRTARALREQGFDACAHCTRRFVSRENE